jgi:hypothetical protein
MQQFNYQQNKVQEGQYVDDHEVDPANPRKFTINSFLNLTGIMKNVSLLKENLRATLFPDQAPEKKQFLIDDQIITYLYGDKRFQKYAAEMANINMRPTFERTFEVANEISAMKNNGTPNRKDAQTIWRAISKIMFLAGQEVYSREGHPRYYSLTEIGVGGIHEDSVDPEKPQQEAAAYLQQMVLVHKAFNIPFTEQDQQRWRATRDRTSFFNILGQLPRGAELQAAVVYNKAQLETPLLEKALDAGIFKGSDMWSNIDRGFQQRVFDKKGEQKELSYGPRFSNLSGVNIPPARYRTNEEFVMAANDRDLEPIDNYFSSMIEYLRDYETYVVQQDSIQAMKALKSGNQQKLPGFEDDGHVNDLIASTNMVEYENSDTIKALAKATGKEVDWVLSKLDFVNDPASPGFAVWSQGAFQKPFLFAPFKRAKDAVFKRPDSDNPITKTNQVLTFFKRFITVNPFDASALFMTPVFLNYDFKELAALPVDFAKTLGSTPGLAKKLFEGERLPSLSEDVQTYPNWSLFVKHGFTAYNYQASMESLWDKLQTVDYRELQTAGANVADGISSVFGLNTAIFQNFIGHNLYNVTDKFYNRFLDQGLQPDEAARLAVKFVNDTSFMLNPDIFGDEGPILVTTLFTRNLTIGFMRLITGSAYPFLNKLSPKIFSIRTGGFGKISNSITHGEASMKDMAFLTRFYQVHLIKTLLAGMLFNGLAQFALSFLDDDEQDERRTSMVR